MSKEELIEKIAALDIQGLIAFFTEQLTLAIGEREAASYASYFIAKAADDYDLADRLLEQWLLEIWDDSDLAPSVKAEAEERIRTLAFASGTWISSK